MFIGGILWEMEERTLERDLNFVKEGDRKNANAVPKIEERVQLWLLS